LFGCVFLPQACEHPFFDELRQPGTTMPDGSPLAPELFQFTTEEMVLSPRMLDVLTPPHIKAAQAAAAAASGTATTATAAAPAASAPAQAASTLTSTETSSSSVNGTAAAAANGATAVAPTPAAGAV
jgi:hypothetical protein